MSKHSVYLFMATFLSICEVSYAQNQWIIVDGKPVLVAPAEPRSFRTGADGSRPQSHSMQKPLPTLPEIISPGSLTDSAIYMLDLRRSMEARTRAEKAIRDEMTKNGAKYGVAAITADAPPPRYLKPSDAIAAGQQWSRSYSPTPAVSGDDLYPLIDPIYSSVPSIREPRAGDHQPTRRFTQTVMMGERLPDGSIAIRPLNQDDAIRYQQETANRDALEAQKKAQEAAAQAEQARRDAQQAQDQSKRAEVERQAKAAEDERKRAEDEARRKKEAAAELEKLASDREASCRLGGAECAYADSRLNSLIERSERFNRTAHCAQFDENHPAPLGGPCAVDAPPCLYCSTVNTLNKERFQADRIQRAIQARSTK